MEKSSKTVLLGMSGGVDSSVAAYILKKDGYDVVGATLQLWEENPTCDISPQVNDAKNICHILNIPHHIFNLEDDFKKYVVDYFVSEYEQGRTPNPCVVCNRYVKFQGLVDMAKKLNIEYIATGHYASIEKNKDRYLLKKGEDIFKDQSYMLYNLNQEQLSKTIFPLGTYTKKEVRDIARKMKLPVAQKPDSQEVCFIKDDDYKGFVKTYGKKNTKEGEFVDINGNVLGHHQGITNYTIGQRRALGVVTGKPMYVINIEKESNRVVLGSNEDLLKKELIANKLNWIYIDKLVKEMKVKAKIRYQASEYDATITPIRDDIVKVIFNIPQRAITSGQSVVFYYNNYVIGGGIIN